MDFYKAPRREGLDLQLTAMIDIFSIIIIFLILGTVFGVVDIAIPPTMRLPQSVSTEVLEPGVSIVIHEDKVKLSIDDVEIDIEDFRAQKASDLLEQQNKKIEEYFKSTKVEERASSKMMSVAADMKLNYKDIFDVIKYYRKAGFESILFVARVNEGAPRD